LFVAKGVASFGSAVGKDEELRGWICLQNGVEGEEWIEWVEGIGCPIWFGCDFAKVLLGVLWHW